MNLLSAISISDRLERIEHYLARIADALDRFNPPIPLPAPVAPEPDSEIIEPAERSQEWDDDQDQGSQELRTQRFPGEVLE